MVGAAGCWCFRFSVGGSTFTPSATWATVLALGVGYQGKSTGKDRGHCPDKRSALLLWLS